MKKRTEYKSQVWFQHEKYYNEINMKWKSWFLTVELKKKKNVFLENEQ